MSENNEPIVMQESTQPSVTVDTTNVQPANGKGRGSWASYALLVLFFISAVCGVYLSLKPGMRCTTASEKQKIPVVFNSSIGDKEGNASVAWIKVRGVIATDNSSSPFSRPQGASAIAKKIREAGENENVKAIVLDINSPGGTVAAVQNIYSEILKAKKNGKKVVALFRDVAASGGFYIAMAADKIVAEPGTITGSVGVIMQTSNVEGLFEKIGVKMVPITSGKYKDMGSSFRPMTDAEKALLQDMVDDTYTQFFAAVKAGRPNVSEENLTEYTDGRVFTGQRAYNLGFVDKLGGEDEALQLAGELAGIKDPKIISSSADSLRDFIFSVGSSMENKSIAKQLESLATPSVSYLWMN
ncbi:MAG: signal peptide peptidase SppA [Elusimicrobiaceae bacterium]|nr:signal peptide peptidase SppA [Elusimicrobiaceae bacterium]